MKRFITYFFILLGLGMMILPAVLIVSAISPRPRVEQGPGLTFDKVKQVKLLVRRHRPRFMRFRQIRTVRIHEQDLNLLLDYAVSQGLKADYVHPDITLSDHLITLWVCLELPKTILGEYANLAVGITHDKKNPEIAFIRTGDLTIPGRLISSFIPILSKLVLPPEIFQVVKDSLAGIESISTRKKTLTLVYDWNPKALLKFHENSKTLLIPRTHQEKLVIYTNKLTRILGVLEAGQTRTISLARVICPLFRFAAGRSFPPHDPILENTALLQSMALYVLGTDLDHLVNVDLLKGVKPRRRSRFTLEGRTDLAKHFLVSAGLAASAGSRLSHFAGLAKEVEDAGSGSGFSFADLAADRAGVKLGELATGSREQARQIQDRMAAGTKEAGFMPAITNLPEGIMELAFKQRYRDLDSQAYGVLDREINRRLNECRVYR